MVLSFCVKDGGEAEPLSFTGEETGLRSEGARMNSHTRKHQGQDAAQVCLTAVKFRLSELLCDNSNNNVIITELSFLKHLLFAPCSVFFIHCLCSSWQLPR